MYIYSRYVKNAHTPHTCMHARAHVILLENLNLQFGKVLNKVPDCSEELAHRTRMRFGLKITLTNAVCFVLFIEQLTHHVSEEKLQ